MHFVKSFMPLDWCLETYDPFGLFVPCERPHAMAWWFEHRGNFYVDI